MLNESRPYLFLIVSCLAGGCSDEGDSAWGAKSDPLSEQSGEENTNNAPDYLELGGRTFIREVLLSPQQRDEIFDRSSWDPPGTLRRTAQEIRLYSNHSEYGSYVELELNLELAQRVQDDESEVTEMSTPPSATREGRSIINATDSRSPSNWATDPGRSIAVYEAGGSGSHIMPNKVYTAAHVLYTPGQGWRCSNGTHSPGGTCSGGNPRWKFGASGTGGYSDWVGCTRVGTIPTAFTTIPSVGTDEQKGWNYAAVDWGVVKYTGCNIPTPHMGTHAISDPSGITFYLAGYPQRMPCPQWSIGSSTDCSSGTIRHDGPPVTSATLYWAGGGIEAGGGSQGTHTWKDFIDSTMGQSGGPIYYWKTTGDPGWYVVGARSQGWGTFNMANRISSSLFTTIQNL